MISGKIKIPHSLTIDNLIHKLKSRSIISSNNNEVVFAFQKNSNFPEFIVKLSISSNYIRYSVKWSSFIPFTIFLFLTALFVGKITNISITISALIVALLVLFSVIVFIDKTTRNFLILNFNLHVIEPEGVVSNDLICPACACKITKYTNKCPECGLYFNQHDKIKSNTNLTYPINVKYIIDD